MMKKNLIAFSFASFLLDSPTRNPQTFLPPLSIRAKALLIANTFGFLQDYKIPFDAHLISKPFLMEKYRGYASVPCAKLLLASSISFSLPLFFKVKFFH